MANVVEFDWTGGPRAFRIAAAVVAALVIGCSPMAQPSPAPVAPQSIPSSSLVAAAVPSAAAGSGYATVPCDHPAQPGKRPAGYLRECGVFRVPENRNRTDSRLIELAVVVVASADATPAADPVLIVAHGAGGETIRANLDGPVVAALRMRHEVILVDGRGTGLSTPSLDCEESSGAAVAGLTVGREAELALELEALVACRARLESMGVDLAGYTTRENAADMAALPPALGYTEWNLYGISYGTREELAVMRAHPAGIRSVILDSVLPPDIDALAEWGPNAALALDVLFAGCAADATCREAHPNLRATFRRLVDELGARPLTLSFEDPWAGLKRTGVANGDTLITATFNALYRTDRIGFLPARIEAIADGDHGLLQEELAHQANAFGSEGAYFRVFCPDDFSWTDVKRIRSAAAAMAEPWIGAPFAWWGAADLQMCTAFGAGRGDPADRAPVVSDIPTLLLSGEYDPVTPPHWGASVANSLSRGTQIVVPGVGHGVVGSGACVDRVANRFLDDPMAAVDPSCALALPLPIFRN